MVSIHLGGGAEIWYEGYTKSKIHVVGSEFKMDVCDQFLKVVHENKVGEFNELV